MVKIELAEVFGNPDEIINREICSNIVGENKKIGRAAMLAVYAYYPVPSGTDRDLKDMMLFGKNKPLSIMTVAEIGDWGYRVVERSDADEKQIVSLQVEKFYSTKPRIEIVAYEYED